MTHVVPRILNDVLSACDVQESCELFFMAGAVFGVSCCYAHCK